MKSGNIGCIWKQQTCMPNRTVKEIGRNSVFIQTGESFWQTLKRRKSKPGWPRTRASPGDLSWEGSCCPSTRGRGTLETTSTLLQPEHTARARPARARRHSPDVSDLRLQLVLALNSLYNSDHVKTNCRARWMRSNTWIFFFFLEFLEGSYKHFCLIFFNIFVLKSCSLFLFKNLFLFFFFFCIFSQEN